MVHRKRETPGKRSKNKAVKVRTEEEGKTEQESTQNEGQDAMQSSIEVERNKYADQTGAEKAEVDQKVAGVPEANEINREDKFTEPKCPGKMVSAEKNRKKNAANLVDGAESAGSLAAETVDVDKLAAERKSDVIVAAKSKNEEIVANKPRSEEYGRGDQKKEEIVDPNQIIGKPEQKCVRKALLEMESPQKVKKILEVAKANESTAKKVELQQINSETVKPAIRGVYQNPGLTKRQRKRLKQLEELNNLEKAETKEDNGLSGQQNWMGKTLEHNKKAEEEIEVTVKTEIKQKLSEKLEIDEAVEKKLENEHSERKKSKKSKRAKKLKTGEVKKVTEEEEEGKKITQEGEKITTVEEGQMKKITEEEGEVKKITQGEGELKTETTQKLSEKMEIDETVEKKVENGHSESKWKKKNKRKRAQKLKAKLKKVTEEEGEGKKITEEGEKKTTVEEGQTKKITEEEGEVKKITQGEGELKTMKVDGTIEKNPENDQSKSKKRNGANIEKEGQVKKTRQEEIAMEEQKKCNATEVIEMLVDSLTRDELLEVVKSTALKVESFLAYVDCVASRDESKRTIYVGNLNYDTNSEMLRKAFLRYGKIEKAEVVVDKESDKGRVFGFVLFTTKSSALSALRDPIKEINGQQSRCSLKNDRRESSFNSYTAIHRPGKSVNPAIYGPGGFVNPTMLGPGEYVDPAIHGPRGFVNPTTLGRGEYVNPPVFDPRVNSTFSGHLNPQAVLGDFQYPNQWGQSNLQYEYSDCQYNEIKHVKRCGCDSIYCDL